MIYSDKVMLAPMVRLGTLPLRLLALTYGADLVYTEETIDKKIVKCVRKENALLNTIDYVEPSGTVVFRTTAAERERVIFQIGTADPETALKAALAVAQDVAAIDVNCGCPKHFSTSGGMGASLLSNQGVLKNILTTLVEKSGKPVTCKIRILSTMEETIQLIKMIESTGVRAVGIHCRTVKERPLDKAHWDVFKTLVKEISIPIIANGDVYDLNDVEKLKAESGVSSFMIARGAIANPSVFRKDGILPLDQVVREYIKLAIDYDQHPANVKYCLMQIITPKHPCYQKITPHKALRPICQEFKMEGYYDEAIRLREKRAAQLAAESLNSSHTLSSSTAAPPAERDADDKEFMPYAPKAQYIPETHRHLLVEDKSVQASDKSITVESKTRNGDNSTDIGIKRPSRDVEYDNENYDLAGCNDNALHVNKRIACDSNSSLN